MNYWSMPREDSAWICVPWSLCRLSQPCPHSSCHNQVCFFQILITLLRLPHKNLLHQAKRNIQFCLLSITCRADSTSPARAEHEPNTSPRISQSFPVPLTLLTQRLEPEDTKMQTLSQPRMQQLPLLRAALGSLP